MLRVLHDRRKPKQHRLEIFKELHTKNFAEKISDALICQKEMRQDKKLERRE